MTKYIIRSENNWILINATYKGSIMAFNSQVDAINYVRSLKKEHKTFIQNISGRFWKINWKDFNKENPIDNTTKVSKEKRIFIPLYVLRRMDERRYFKKIVKRKLIFKLIIIFSIISIILVALFVSLFEFDILNFNM